MATGPASLRSPFSSAGSPRPVSLSICTVVMAACSRNSRPTAQVRFIRTIGGLQDGDEFEVRFGSGSTIVATPTFVFDSSLSGVEEYVADAGSCQDSVPGTELALTLMITSACVNVADTYDVLATAVDENFNAIAWSLLDDIGVATTTANMPAWSTGFASQAISLENGPPGHFSASGDLVEEGGNFDLYNAAGSDVIGGSADVVLSMPSDFGYALSSTYFVYDDSDILRLALHYDRRAVIEAVSLDFSVDFYPYIEDASFDGSVRPEVTFMGSPTDADFALFHANWDDNSSYTFWTFLLPPNVEGSVRFPELPDGVVPSASPYFLQFDFYDASYLDGYDEYRTGALAPRPSTRGYSSRRCTRRKRNSPSYRTCRQS